MLTLAEELLLLALDDESGAVEPAVSGSLQYGLAGALLMELVLAGRLGMQDGRLVPLDETPTGDGLLDEVAGMIRSGEPREPGFWVERLGRRDPKDALLPRLVEKGILRRDRRRVLWLIPSVRYPTLDGRPERDVRERVREVVFGGAEPLPRDAALLGLIKACDLVDVVFRAGERRRAHERLDSLTRGELIGRAVSGAVRQAREDDFFAAQAAAAGAVVSATSSCSSGGSC